MVERGVSSGTVNESRVVDTSSFRPAKDDLMRTLRGATPADVVLLVQQCMRVYHLEEALAICEAARALGVDDPALDVSEAMVWSAAGNPSRALELLDGLLGASPGHLVALFQKALIVARRGDRAESRRILDGIIAQFPDFPGAQGALAALIFPGPPYREVLAQIHRLRRPDTYLEIGVEHGATLALATTASVAAGVDPADLPIEKPLPKGARLYRLKSDEFFERESPESVFGGKPVDFAFIDGMHWFEFALRDFAHIERWASKDSVIVLHDCLPVTTVAARRDRLSTFWVGDVWKALECLLERRPDLSIHVVPTAPSGLVVVRRLDPSSHLLLDEAASIDERYRDATYPHEPGAWPERYRVVENNEAGLVRALGI
jgi:hypothetical protein